MPFGGLGLAGAELKVGHYLNCVIEEVKGNGGVVGLSIGHSEVSTAIATEEQNWTLNNLLPGLVVKAQVQKVSHSLSLLFSEIKIIFTEVVLCTQPEIVLSSRVAIGHM